MDLKFRPKFKRDLQEIKARKELNKQVLSIIQQIKSAKNISELPGHKFLNKYKNPPENKN